MLAYIDRYMFVFDYPTEFLKVTCQTNHSLGKHSCWVGAARRLEDFLHGLEKSWVSHGQRIQGVAWSRENISLTLWSFIAHAELNCYIT
jgi:hypothetical protein